MSFCLYLIIFRIPGTDDAQFGIKKGLGCANAIFAVRTTVDYFVHRGSAVYTAALDISKAYDSVHHFKLFDCLVRAGLPMWTVNLLVDSYINCLWRLGGMIACLPFLKLVVESGKAVRFSRRCSVNS